MTNMWDAATLDYEQERLDGFVAAAAVAVADQHGFVLQASTRQEFDDRVAIVAEAVESAVGRVTHGDSAAFPIVHQSVLASWEQDFDMVAEARQLETQRQNARRAFFRRGGSRKVAWTEDESDVTPMARKLMKKKREGGFKVVDDESGASSGTVYPNKQIADQADYGEGYSVQYTEDAVKSAGLKTADMEWKYQERYGWFVNPRDFRYGQWAKITDAGDGSFMLAIMAADGGDTMPDTMLTHERYPSLREAMMAAEYWRTTASKTASWERTGGLWVSHTGSRVMEVAEVEGRFVWGSYRTDDSVIAEGYAPTLDLAKQAAENPFVKKDDDKKAEPKNDMTDSDKDGEQDGPTQPGEQPEPAGNDATAAPAAPADPAAAPAADPAAQPPADQQQAPVDPNAPQADPAAVDATGQDKGQAQDPASTSDAVQDQQQPADPTVMDVGQSTSMGFTMVEGGSAGSIEVTFVREENGVYFFNGPTGEFGVGQMNGQWQDADGNTFTFGGAAPAPQGIGPAQEQAAAADAATPVPTPAGNAQAAPQGAQPAAAPPVAAPAKDDSANPAEAPAPDAEKKDDAPPAKDDGEKKENPFAKKSGS